MISFFKKKTNATPIRTKSGVRQYRQVAVTPEAHSKLSKLALNSDRSIIDTVDSLLGV